VKPVTIKMIDAKTKEHVETLEVDACMVATGRVPNTKGLGLDAMGVETVRGFVQVNDKMQVMPLICSSIYIKQYALLCYAIVNVHYAMTYLSLI
jgi:pyruvate/2-oxoglutarate dehydrogenase complex dihydrolipoamide dehydrogenase (E3) component